MRKARTGLGIMVTSAAVGLGCLLWGLAGSAWAETSDAKVLDQPPKGFFVSLTLAQGYKESLDSYQTERFKPVNPGTTFKADVEAVYMVFDLLPRENPANVIGQLFPCFSAAASVGRKRLAFELRTCSCAKSIG